MNNQDGLTITRWLLIAVYLGVTILSAFSKSEFIMQISPIITVLSIFTVVSLHGIARYGIKNLILFFLITWLISNFFEALSIQVGFPFGHYYYDKLIGPRLFEVPVIIMLAYFGTGYSAWILSHVLLGQYSKPLKGKAIVAVPVVASFIMVMWDLCMDPLCSTVASFWVWKDGGMYFGVPLQNFFGWFLVVYIIYQLFALYLAKWATPYTHKKFGALFWLEIVVVYGILGLTQWLQYFVAETHQEIYGVMALVTVFTMMFVTLMSFLKVTMSSND